MLRILHGPFHPELEEAFVAELRAVKKRKPLAPVIVVAPSQRLARHLASVAAHAFPQGVAAVRFHNLFSLARAIDEETPDPALRFVDDADLLERLVVEIVARDFRDRPYLRHALSIPGTARAVLGAIKELRDGAVDPAAALEAMREGHLTGGEDSVKLGELLSLHYFYAKELRDRGWRDRADVVLRAAELAPRSKLLAAQSSILYYGFYELIQTQLDLFNRIARTFPVTCFYPYAELPEFAFCRDFFTTALVGEKIPLAPSLFGGQARRRVVSASGARDEVWAAAKEILKLRDRGIPFDEIGVVARTLEPYGDHVEAVFRENRIPFVSSARIPERLEREIALLSVADDDFPRDQVVALVNGDDQALWDLVTRKLGIGRGLSEWEKRLYPLDGRDWEHVESDRADRPRLRVPADRTTALVRAVRDLVARTQGPASGSWSDHAAWARALIGNRREIDSLAAFDGIAPPPTGAEFRRLLRDRLRHATRRAGCDNIRGVHVLDAMAARGLSFRAVLILGLNERVWPRFILEDPFLPDAVRSQIKFRLGSLLPQKLAGYDEEKLLFASATLAAREELVLLYQRSDEKGRVQVRSPFLDTTGRPVPRRPGAKFEECAVELLTPKEVAVRALLKTPRHAARGEAVARAFGWDADAFAASAQFLRALEDDREIGPRDGIVGRLDGFWTALAARGLSPTSLETFSECRFKFFAQKTLALEPLEAPEDEFEVTPLETGSLYHDFLERFYKAYAGRELPATLNDARKTFEAILTETFRDFERSRTMLYPLLWEAERARMRQVLEAFVAHDLTHRDGFVPAFFEEKVAGPLPLPLGRHADVNFMGYVDRLDVHPDGAFRVIDYKSHRSGKYAQSIESGAIESGRYLQPPIYFLLAAKFLGERGYRTALEASASGYEFLREYAERGKDPEMWLTGDFWERRDEFAAALAARLDGIAAGAFPIVEGGWCSWCDFSPMCRRRHQPTRWRARRAMEAVE